MTRPPFPSVIDNSLLSSFRSCPRKCLYEYFEHWKPRTPSIHLHAGAAYARGLEVARHSFYVEGKPDQQAVADGIRALMQAYGDFECPPDSAKSLERMCGALEYNFHTYPLSQDAAVPIALPGGKRGIEFSFAEPLDLAGYDLTNPETGDPLLYVGRFDGLVNYAGAIYGLDDKTTSSLGASWPKQWDLRAQFTGYAWGAQQSGINVQGFLVRGISILKTKYETLQPITYRPGWMISEWLEQTARDVTRMKQLWEEGYWDMNLDHACTEYGGCLFRTVCMSEPSSRQQWLETGFERRRWDPVHRVETKVEAE